MKVSSTLLAFCLFSVACEGGIGSNDAFGTGDTAPEQLAKKLISGDRLKARWYQGDDGSEAFQGWHDTLFDVPCRYRPALGEDGEVVNRCLPDGYFFPRGDKADTRTLSEDCTQRVYEGRVGCSGDGEALGRAFALIFDENSACAGQPAVTQVLRGLQYSDVYPYERESDGGCSRDTGFQWSNRSFYFTAEETIPLEDFVAGTLQLR